MLRFSICSPMMVAMSVSMMSTSVHVMSTSVHAVRAVSMQILLGLEFELRSLLTEV